MLLSLGGTPFSCPGPFQGYICPVWAYPSPGDGDTPDRTRGYLQIQPGQDRPLVVTQEDFHVLVCTGFPPLCCRLTSTMDIYYCGLHWI